MEGKVYICSWSKDSSGYHLWVKNSPHIRGDGPTYDEAEERLIVAVGMLYGDGEPILDFIPELPPSSDVERYYQPPLLLVCGDPLFQKAEPRFPAFATPEEILITQKYLDQFFTGGLCRTCGAPLGERTTRPIEVIDSLRGVDGGRVVLGRATRRIFSQEFLNLLDKKDRAELSFLPVKGPKGSRRKFFELNTPPILPFVSTKNHNPTGWQCKSCGYRCFTHVLPNYEGLINFISKKDLPDIIPSCFTVGDIYSPDLCLKKELWLKIHGKKGTRSVLGWYLGVVGPSEMVERPNLKIRDD